MKRTAVLLFALCLPAFPQDAVKGREAPLGYTLTSPHPKHQALYRWSVVAMTAASAADVASSWGKTELNPALGRGQFGFRQTGIKVSISAGVLTAQWWQLRKHPELRKGMAISNFAVAGGLGAVAAGNWKGWGQR
jgi:hypothetical protein